MLTSPVSVVKGVGAKRAELFGKMQISTVEDLLFCLPRDYQDFSVLRDPAQAEHGEWIAAKVRLQGTPKRFWFRKMAMISMAATVGDTKLQLVWFNQPYRMQQLPADGELVACGRLDRQKGLRLLNPVLCPALPGILPVYSAVKGLAQSYVRKAVENALQLALGEIPERMPASFLAQYGLCPAQQALRAIHFPQNLEELRQARRRMDFEQMLYYFIGIERLRGQRTLHPGKAFHTEGLAEAFLQKMTFPLTAAQRRVMQEVEADMQKPLPMNRLIQGDVGAGKTVLAQYALFVAMQNGSQGVLMAPTDILARQHEKGLRKLFGDEVCLLTGHMSAMEKREACRRIRAGEVHIIVGTHAVLQKDVVYQKLELVVTDEQHRFGVRQRAAIAEKGVSPDVLIMSATPIPRTLALLLYGDLDLSVVDELPPGRKPVITRLVPQHRRQDLYAYLEQQAGQGNQSYVVCPLVEASDTLEQVQSAGELFKDLSQRLTVPVGLLHGRMSSAEKEQVMEAFRAKDIGVLVATTVVEVGMDVPDAAVMVIENADRFGLAQLHQLRGRVGRGRQQAYCFLLTQTASESALERLRMFVQTADGFAIAQKDLELRGPGEFFGTRQHGADSLVMQRLGGEKELLMQVQQAAALVAQYGNEAEYAPLLQQAQRLWDGQKKDIALN